MSRRSLALVLRSSFLLLLVAGGLTGPEALAQRVRFGLEAGLSSISHRYSEVPETWDLLFRTSYSVMTFADIDTRSDLDFQVGVRYVPLGAAYDYSAEVPEEGSSQNILREGTITITQQYLFFSLRARYQIGATPLYAIAGPELGFLLDASLEQDEQVPEPVLTNSNIDPQINGVNTTLGGGLGVRRPLGKLQVYTQAMVLLGLQDVPQEQFWARTWRTRELTLLVGVVL